jgi:Icc-related predicted phosphoesterase
MKILSLSDKTVSFIYSPVVRQKFKDIDLVIGCGDLSYYYLEYVMDALNAPLFYVRGNHDHQKEVDGDNIRSGPDGGIDLHRKVVEHKGILLAGVEGSIRYRNGDFQYSQSQMWKHTFALVPRLIVNNRRKGRYLDIFVTHSPPLQIHDREDLPHRGIKAFHWLIRVFQPVFAFHGHVHLYQPDEIRQSYLGRSTIINTYGYRETEWDLK